MTTPLLQTLWLKLQVNPQPLSPTSFSFIAGSRLDRVLYLGRGCRGDLGGVVQLAEYLPSMPRIKLGTVMYVSNPSTQVDVGGSDSGHPLLHSQFWVSLDYVRPSLRQQRKLI